MGMSVDNCYTELIQLRNLNKILAERIKHLELQNFNMSKEGFFKPKHHEPIRAIFDENPPTDERLQTLSSFSNALPRPHHDLSAIKQFSTAKKVDYPPETKFEPVPDGRFFTKANFYSPRDED